jgi:hypothetical protein
METLTIEYDAQNTAIRQIVEGLVAMGVFRLKDGEDEFDRDLKRAISGDELMSRLSARIYKTFENESALSTGS